MKVGFARAVRRNAAPGNQRRQSARRSAVHEIESLTLYHGRVPTHQRYSYGVVDTMPLNVVVIETAEHAGYGELVKPEQFRTLGEPLLGRDARGRDALLPSVDEMDRAYGASREAISTALWDLNARIYGVPLYVLFGGRRRYPVPLMPVIFVDEPEQTAATAKDFVERFGFRAVKLKFEGDADQDLGTLRAVRAAVGSEILIHADANAGYKDLDAALGMLREAEKLDLFSIEDPLSLSLDASPLVGATKVKIAGDMSTRTTADLLRVIETGAIDILWQHPCQQCGVDEFMRRRKLASAHGIPAWIGGSGSFGMRTAAYQHLGCALVSPGDDGLPVGEVGAFIDHHASVMAVKEPLPVRGGSVYLDEAGSGSGVEPDYEVLEEHCERIVMT